MGWMLLGGRRSWVVVGACAPAIGVAGTLAGPAGDDTHGGAPGECPEQSADYESDFFTAQFIGDIHPTDWVYQQPAHVHMVTTWMPGSGDTLLSLTKTVTGFTDQGTSTATETFEIVRTTS